MFWVFLFIFRGALDVRATVINEEMKIAAVHALKDLAKLPVPQVVLDACHIKSLSFGPDYIIPNPLDPRLLDAVACAVANAAMESGVAQLEAPEYCSIPVSAEVTSG